MFTSSLTCWLMVSQSLGRGASLNHAVWELQTGIGAELSGDPARVLEGRISSATGGYARARTRLSPSLVERAFDAIFTHLSSEEPGTFLLDGTSIRAPSTPALRRAFPPAPNQHGNSHWPLLRVVVAHDLDRALAARPAWGPMYGKEATSEQGLCLSVLDRLPRGAMVVADRNFGVFSVAWGCRKRGLVPVVRMTKARAKALMGKADLPWGGEAKVFWRPSAEERRKYEDLPKDALLEGRVVAMRIPREGRKTVELLLFTTDETLTVEELTQLYARRWEVETDLRTLKSHLDLETLHSLSPEMAGKELILAVAAYNLVRALMGEAAKLHGLDARRLSFAWSLSLVKGMGSPDCTIPLERRMQRLMKLIAAKTNPLRTKRKEPERKIWPKPKGFPFFKAGDTRV